MQTNISMTFDKNVFSDRERNVILTAATMELSNFLKEIIGGDATYGLFLLSTLLEIFIKENIDEWKMPTGEDIKLNFEIS